MTEEEEFEADEKARIAALHKTAPETIWLQVDTEVAQWDGYECQTWCEDRINDTDLEYVRADLVEELRQQLAAAKEREQTNDTLLEQQGDKLAALHDLLDDHRKREVMLRDAMFGAWRDGYGLWGSEGMTEQQIAFEEALAATDNLKDVRLCHAEPVAWKYEQEHFDSMGGISTEYTLHKFECAGRSQWEPRYRAWEPKK